jgi:uncharacterized protein YjaG (DUF416 family)
MVEVLVMAGNPFDLEKLKSHLSGLSYRHALTFGVWQLERMIPNFIHFCMETQSIGVWVLKSATSYAWSVIETGNTHRFDELTEHLLETIAPETVDSKSIYTSSALDTVVSAANLINYIRTGKIDLIVEMASLARDSADVFLQLTVYVDENDENVEEEIRTHPLMQLELQRQDADIIFLERLKDDDHFFPAVLARSLAESYGEKWL